jgi:O-antigen ligase
MISTDPNREAAGDGRGRLLQVASWLTFSLPVVLPYARSVADGMLTLVAVLFLADRCTGRDWRWLKSPETLAMLALWGWIAFCTLAAGQIAPIGQAVASIRFFVFVAALANWVLTDLRARHRLWYVILGMALWVVVECWQQQLFGISVVGSRRFGDGALMGPFFRPIAGQTYAYLLFPAFLPLCAMISRRGGWLNQLCAIGILAAAAATMLMIGQRMPTMLMLLGLCVAGLLFRQFRLAAAVAIVAGVAVLALMPAISPLAFAKLGIKFSQQLAHFWDTPYGWLFGRAATMIQAHPWLGLGWDGFRNHCGDAAYMAGVSWLPIADPANPEGCNIHPHNYWTLIGTTAGLPGLALFAVLSFLWLRKIAGHRPSRNNGWRSALLVVAVVMLWPIASTTALFTLPNAGWFFLTIGWGLAEASDDPA